jgi:hypothetical protein
MIVNSAYSVDSLELMENIHKFHIHLVDEITNLGKCFIKLTIYLSNHNLSSLNVINDPPLNYTERNHFYEIFGMRLIEMIKIQSLTVLKKGDALQSESIK